MKRGVNQWGFSEDAYIFFWKWKAMDLPWEKKVPSSTKDQSLYFLDVYKKNVNEFCTLLSTIEFVVVPQAFFLTLVRILLALEKAGNLSFGHFYLSFFHFYPEFFVFFTEIPSIFAGNMGFQENIPEFLEKRSEFGRKPEFYADLSFGSSVKKKPGTIDLVF